MLALILRIPSVQNKLASRITKQINQNLQTEIRVKEVSIGFNGAVNFNSFFVADHQADTLFYADNFKTDLYSLKQWVNGKLFFSYADFEGVLLKVVQYEGEENNSLSRFTDQLLAHLNLKDRDPFVRIDQFNITDGSYKKVDLNKKDKPFFMEEISLVGKDFFYVNNGFDLTLSSFNLRTPDFSKISLLETDINYNPCALNINHLLLVSGESEITGDIKLILPQEKELNFLDNTDFSIDLTSRLYGDQLHQLFEIPSGTSPFNIKMLAQGNFNDFKISSFQIDHDALNVEALVHLKDVFNSSPISADIKLSEFYLNTPALNSLLPTKFIEKIPPRALFLPPLSAIGEGVYKQQSLQTSLVFAVDDGAVKTKTNFQFIEGKNGLQLNQFSGTADAKLLDLSSFHEKLGDITSKLSWKGTKNEGEEFEFSYALKLDEIGFNNLTLNNISAKGSLDDKLINADIVVDNRYITAQSALAFSLENQQHQYQLDLNLEELNLHAFDPELGGGKARYSGDFNLFLVGNSIDEIQGNLLFKNLKFENIKKKESFNDFIFETNFSGNNRSIRSINSQIFDINIEGQFQLTRLLDVFSNALAETFPFYKSIGFDKPQEITYDLSIQTDHLNAVFPELFFEKKAIFRGILSTEDKVSKMTLGIPKLIFNGMDLENVELILDNQNPFFNTFVSVGKIENDFYTISGLNTLGLKGEDNTLNFRTEFKGNNDIFELNYGLSIKNEKTTFFLKPSKIKFQDHDWRINPMADDDHLISYDFATKVIDLRYLKLQSGTESIEIEGNLFSTENFRLSLKVVNGSLGKLGISTEKFDLKGVLDLNLDIQRSPSDNKLAFNGSIEKYNINDQDMGTLRFFTSGNTQLNSYELSVLLSNQEQNTLIVNGSILGFDESPKLNLDFKFDDFDLSFLEPLGGEGIDNIRGRVSGNVNLWGPLNAPKHMGTLILNGGGLRIINVNTDYSIADATEVTLEEQIFKFNNTAFSDTQFGTQGAIKGEINHLNFRDWGFDLFIDSDRILMLNRPEREEEIFFGDGFFGGNVHLYGPSKNLTIDLIGATEEGTSIKIPWADDYGLADTSFINFINKKNNVLSLDKKIDSDFEFSGLEMNFELDVTNNAEIKVVIDKESGSFLSGRGAGNILMEIDTNGKFNMWGDFITYQGIYNFKNLGLIDKKFNLKPGGTIVWEGDPLGAQMDLEAVYNVPGGANPALLLDNPNFNRKIPTEVLIRLQGNLLKPDDPIFEIDFPNTSSIFTSEINYRLADPQISQLQAISLLSQGIFINEVSVSVQGITNNLYEKASDLFSDLLGNDEGKLQVGVNYLQGDKSRLVEANSEDRLGLTLSTQITDKILLNGNIGVPVGGIEETLIVGDLQIDFILNEEGSLKAKVFNKENEFRYLGDELGYTQGVGLSYQVDFETFRELMKKIVNGNPDLNKAIEPNVQLLDPSDTGLNFIDKK